MASLPKNDSNLLSAPENHAMNSIKRAAVSFLSAAAVKAKLLVNQEEEKNLTVDFICNREAALSYSSITCRDLWVSLKCFCFQVKPFRF
ncbi:hypothetical protein HPP92_020944 [Vanilla planifolia]|uniref:Uncharacterized protein n=1 Tax=Vanilla planifolia TaxID=51239 RepID=A0A835Q4M3_VANPL|nr:hypothetical protein HPP92_020944 [Vanilla planifolia]